MLRLSLLVKLSHNLASPEVSLVEFSEALSLWMDIDRHTTASPIQALVAYTGPSRSRKLQVLFTRALAKNFTDHCKANLHVTTVGHGYTSHQHVDHSSVYHRSILAKTTLTISNSDELVAYNQRVLIRAILPRHYPATRLLLRDC